MKKIFDFSLRHYDEEYYRIYEKARQVDPDRIPSFDLLKKFLDPHPGERILDAGCGAGHLLDYIINGSGAAGYGIDFSNAALKTAVACFPMGRYMLVDVRALAVRDRTFDKVVCFNVIEHIAEQDDVMIEFKRILKKNGLLVIGTNIRDSVAWHLYQFFIGEHTHVREFTVKEFLDFLGRHFEIVAHRKSSGVFRFGPPISWVFHHVLLGDIIVLCRNKA